MLAFLVPILSPEKPYNITLILATTLFLAYSEKKVVDWRSIIGELVHRLATNTKRRQPSYIGHFLFHLYTHKNLLTDEEKIQWTGRQIMRELQTTDSEPEMGQEYSKEEDAADFSNEERPMSKKQKMMLGNLATRTRSVAKPGGGGTSTFTLEDNLLDSIIRDLKGVRFRIAEYELQMQQVGNLWKTLRGRIWLVQYKKPFKIRAGCGSWSVRWTTLLRKIGRPRNKCGN